MAHATTVWQRCKLMRATREKEFRYHVVKLKLLLTGAAQTLDTAAGFPLSLAA